VIGGLGGGPWLDGRVRSVSAAIGSVAAALDDTTARYANVAEIALAAIKALSEDVRASRQIRGSAPLAHES
jgi:3-methyl-2-oxobutanoate hydroxymethyltransferase